MYPRPCHRECLKTGSNCDLLCTPTSLKEIDTLLNSTEVQTTMDTDIRLLFILIPIILDSTARQKTLALFFDRVLWQTTGGIVVF